MLAMTMSPAKTAELSEISFTDLLDAARMPDGKGEGQGALKYSIKCDNITYFSKLAHIPRHFSLYLI